MFGYVSQMTGLTGSERENALPRKTRVLDLGLIFHVMAGRSFPLFVWRGSRPEKVTMRCVTQSMRIEPMAYARDQFGREWDAPCNSANDCEETNGLWVRRFRRGATKFQRRCLGNARNNERCRTKTHSLILLILEP